MSLAYFQGHAENALFALELAEREAAQMPLGIVARLRDQARQLGLPRHATD